MTCLGPPRSRPPHALLFVAFQQACPLGVFGKLHSAGVNEAFTSGYHSILSHSPAGGSGCAVECGSLSQRATFLLRSSVFASVHH